MADRSCAGGPADLGPPARPAPTMAGVTAHAVPHPASLPGADREAASDFPWRSFALRGLQNQGLCLVVAMVIWLMTTGLRGTLFTAWAFSAAIGTGSWFFIDGGRLLLAGWLPSAGRLHGGGRAQWPGPRWMLLCIIVGTALGYTLGSAVGDLVTGFKTPSLLQNRPALAITAVAAIAATWYFYVTERLRQEQANAESARRAAAESQLRLLQSQLEPHMLFNTLANLRVLVTLDPPRAQAMLDRLIGYLRATLGASRQDLHPLANEFRMLDDYLALMRMRMGPRLQVRLSLPDALRQLPVPPLLLQPLVENSIRHGLEPKVAGGRIEVQACQRGGQLSLTVRDTGVGLAASATGAGPGLAGVGPPPAGRPGDAAEASRYGTSHVAERLQALYGDAARFRLSDVADDEGGTLAELLLPLPPAPPQAP